MSVKNFIPEIWSQYMIDTLQKTAVFGATANRQYEGEIKEAGDQVKIDMVGDVTVSSYVDGTTSITPSALVAAQSILKIDTAKYFAFKVSDIDKAQAKGDLMGKGMQKAVYGFRNAQDQALAAMYAQAGLNVTVGDSANSNSNCVDLTSVNIEEYLSKISQVMDENDVPEEGRFGIVPPWVKSKLLLTGIESLTDNIEPWTNGRIGRAFGFQFLQSNNVSKNSTDWDQTRCIFGVTGESFALAEQIVKTEAYRPESSFDDAVKGLHVWGGKILRPDMTLTFYCDETAEPA